MAKKKEKPKVKKVAYQELLSSVRDHFDEAKAELTVRSNHKTQGFDEYDNLYRSWIDSSKWPFNAKIFIPLSFKAIYSKDTRLITGKIRGKLIAGEYGSELGARIGTELLSSQYDDHDNFFEEPLISKYFRFSQNARKYGAGFGLVAWRREVRNGEVVFDGPTFEVLDNRKVYLQPGAVSISTSDYVIVERETTLDELERINRAALIKGEKPVYQNLDKLREIKSNSITPEVSSRNTYIRGLDDKRKGKGKFAPFRILTEYRKDKWITWCPDVGGDKGKDIPGLVLRVIDNPYDHKQIPIVRLVYIPIDDDIYGVSELEPVRTEQKAVNALASGFIEAVSNELYPILKGHPTNVDWKTIEFKPRAAWIMNNPQADLVRFEGQITFTRNFVEAYRLLVSTFAEGMGETAADASNLAALATDKTATEIRDLALQRTSRDNLNKLFLAAAISKIYQFWWSMNQQFLTDKKVIRIAGKDALKYFVNEGLSGWTLTEEGFRLIETVIDEEAQRGNDISFEEAYEILRENGVLDEYAVPLYPVQMGGETLPKLQVSDDGKTGFLSVEDTDLTGKYRFVVDLNTVGMPNEQQEAQALTVFLDRIEKAQQQIAQEGYRVKFKELLETVAEKLKIKNADQYFEPIPEEERMQQQTAQQPLEQPIVQEGVTPEQILAQGVTQNAGQAG